MAISGLRDTSNFVTDERPKNWREGIMLLWPNGKAPLFALTSLMKTKVTDDPEFYWWEKVMNAQRVRLGADAGTSTSITLASGQALAGGIKVGHLLLVENTGEIVYVSGVSTDTLTVVRSIGDIAATDVDYDGNGVNEYLAVIGTNHEEGSSKPTGINFDPTKRVNYTQIFRDNLEITETAAATNLRTGDAVREAKRECLEIHSLGIERALWFGEGDGTRTLNGRPARLTYGVREWIQDNAPAANYISTVGSLDMIDIEDYMEVAFRYGSSEKMAFCGNRAMKFVQRAARKNASFELIQGQKEFGMNISRLVSPFGELVLKTHPVFNQFISTTNATTGATVYNAYDSMIVILDMKELVYRPLRGRDTFFKGNQETPGDDAMISGYITEMGLEIHHPETHMVLIGLSAGAQDA